MYKIDYIYENLLLTESEEDLFISGLLINDNHDLIPRAEFLKQRLLRSKYGSLSGVCNSTETIILLLLHRQFITAEQIKTLNIFSNASTAVSVRLSQLLKKGIIESKYIDKSINGNKFYTLKNTCKELSGINSYIPECYLEHNGISKATPHVGNMAHDTELLNLFYYLIGDTNFPNFQWLDNPKLKLDNQSINALLQNINSPNNSSLSILPDALIIPWNKEDNSMYFVEQDMRTERGKHLTEKLERYRELLSTINKNEIGNLSILFTIKPSEVSDGSNQFDKLKRTYNDLKKLMLSIPLTSLKDVSEHLAKLIAEEKKKIKGKKSLLNWYLSMYQLISVVRANNNRADSLENILEYINMVHKKLDDQNSYKEKIKLDKQLSVRRSALENSLKDDSSIIDLLHNGLSILVASSKDFSRLDDKFIYQYGTYKRVMSNVLKLYFKHTFKYSYLPFGNIFSNKINFVFRNLITLNNNSSHCVIENLSWDIGAKYRVIRFLNECDYKNDNCTLILIVDSEEDAKKFYIDNDILMRCKYLSQDEQIVSNIQLLFTVLNRDGKDDKLFYINPQEHIVVLS